MIHVIGKTRSHASFQRVPARSLKINWMIPGMPVPTGAWRHRATVTRSKQVHTLQDQNATGFGRKQSPSTLRGQLRLFALQPGDADLQHKPAKAHAQVARMPWKAGRFAAIFLSHLRQHTASPERCPCLWTDNSVRHKALAALESPHRRLGIEPSQHMPIRGAKSLRPVFKNATCMQNGTRAIFGHGLAFTFWSHGNVHPTSPHRYGAAPCLSTPPSLAKLSE